MGTLDGFPGQDSSCIHSKLSCSEQNVLTMYAVANSDTPRLPTLKELIGYQTYDYTTTQSSVLFNLLAAIDINEDVGLPNRVGNEQPKSNAKTLQRNELSSVFYNTNENPLNGEPNHVFVEHDTDTNDIDDESSISKRRKTRIDHAGTLTTTVKPTTIRGTPISILTAKPVTRGFYITKDDVETTVATYTTLDYLTSTTESSLENESTIRSVNTSDVVESTTVRMSKEFMTTTIKDTDDPYKEYSSTITKPAPTTPLTTTIKIVGETTRNNEASSINDVSSVKPRRRTRGRVRYTDGTTALYGGRVRGRIRGTTEPNYSKISISSTSKDDVVFKKESTTTRYNELQSSTNLMADTIVSSSRNIERKTTPLYYTLQTQSDTTIPETSTSMTTELEVQTIQPESTTVTSNTQLTEETEDQTDTNEIISDKNDEYVSTITLDYSTKHDITTTKHGLTTPSFEATSEMIASIKETETTETTNVEATTTSDFKTENILYDVTTTTPELINTVVSISSPRIKQTTTFSETTQFPSTSSPNPSSSENPITTQEIKEENIPRQRQRLNNQFGQRRRANGYRRVVQPKEIGERTSTQEESNNSKPNVRHRVRINRRRQHRPNLTSSSTEANDLVSIDDTKPNIAEEQTRSNLGIRRLKVNRNKYDEETIPTEQNSIQDTTPPTLVTEEYTERPVNEGTLSKNFGSSSNRTKPGTNILVNRLRNTNGSLQSNRPSTVLGDNRQSRPSGSSTVSPTTTIVDAFEDATVSSPEQSVKDEDERAEISDQNGRAQELAVTLADPPISQSSSNTGRLPLRDTLRRRISTTVAPRTDSPRTSSTNSLRFSTVSRNRQRQTSTTRKEGTTRSSTSRPRRPTIKDYDYYEDEETPIVEKAMYNGKLYLTGNGSIKCLDQGNFPHPYSCKKFITCARIVNGLVVGAEYTCPDKLSFDPVGGICNWSAGLGCKE